MTGWYKNQIAFFERYVLPLAHSLAEIEVLEKEDARKLVSNVEQNILRWMVEGKNVVQKYKNSDAK